MAITPPKVPVCQALKEKINLAIERTSRCVVEWFRDAVLDRPNASLIQLSIQSQLLIMPPRRAVGDHPARRNVEEQEVPNAPEMQPQGEVTNAKFRETIRMLIQAVTNQHVKEEKLRDREEFKNKRAKTRNESGQQKNNANRSSFQQKQKGHAPSSTSALHQRTKVSIIVRISELNLPMLRVVWRKGGSKLPACAKCDPGASLSFVTPYVAMNFVVIPEQLSEPYSVSTPVGESIIT
uniref:Gag-pol polyprotein n=1 Tax=Solanum tuberosum TaxID=4113 RepID=M1DMD7_SOLTU